MKKSQIYTLLDVPHFHEGLFCVKKWNYILNFYTGSGDDYVSCQYQIRYDKDMRVESTHWRTQQCADLVNMPAKVAAVAPQVVEKVVYVDRPTPAAPATRPVNRGYVVTFDTGSAVLDGGDIEILETAVAAAKQAGSSSLSVVGHTDTVGSESYNRALREKRSKAVASALKIIAANGGTEVSVSTSTSPDLAVPTGDETPEEANRRVTVYVN
jgi:outer membrane protein OmpA-like peptidoglycan-associated protein